MKVFLPFEPLPQLLVPGLSTRMEAVNPSLTEYKYKESEQKIRTKSTNFIGKKYLSS